MHLCNNNSTNLLSSITPIHATSAASCDRPHRDQKAPHPNHPTRNSNRRVSPHWTPFMSVRPLPGARMADKPRNPGVVFLLSLLGLSSCFLPGGRLPVFSHVVVFLVSLLWPSSRFLSLCRLLGFSFVVHVFASRMWSSSVFLSSHCFVSCRHSSGVMKTP